jgi:F0F1-type ATP synthase assembly protein I
MNPRRSGGPASAGRQLEERRREMNGGKGRSVSPVFMAMIGGLVIGCGLGWFLDQVLPDVKRRHLWPPFAALVGMFAGLFVSFLVRFVRRKN